MNAKQTTFWHSGSPQSRMPCSYSRTDIDIPLRSRTMHICSLTQYDAVAKCKCTVIIVAQCTCAMIISIAQCGCAVIISVTQYTHTVIISVAQCACTVIRKNIYNFWLCATSPWLVLHAQCLLVTIINVIFALPTICKHRRNGRTGAQH